MATSRISPREALDFKIIFAAHNHVSIAAPPLAVLTAILDTKSWNTWNTFNRSARIYFRPHSKSSASYPPELSALFSRPDFLCPGCKFTESNHRNGTDLPLPPPEGGTTNNLEIVSIEEFETKDGAKRYRLVWDLIDWSGWLMKSRRVHEFVENGGKTEYHSWTELGGLLAWVIRWTSAGATMKLRFDEAFESLRGYLESKGAGAEGRAREEEGTQA